ncbi:MAG TPA: hypothetical protein VGK97_10025 [Spongiibacteraceae bacterium]
MAQLNVGGSAAVAQEIQSVRALFAAESGAQIMAMKIFPHDVVNPVCAATFTQPFTVGGLNGCSATITCASISDGAGHTVFTVQSDAFCGTGSDRARRKIQVRLRNL